MAVCILGLTVASMVEDWVKEHMASILEARDIYDETL